MNTSGQNSTSPIEMRRREQILPTALTLPSCAIPRPGDSVTWYQDTQKFAGELIGHTAHGQPYIKNKLDSISILPSFNWIRHEHPDRALGPNWLRLPPEARILRVYENEQQAFDWVLSQHTPPGSRYRDLVTEIWTRGFEVFVVGGTVRDILSREAKIGQSPMDVDLATTMPLTHMLPLVQGMYGKPRDLDGAAMRNGHLRLGGKPGSLDPFLDVCVFKYSRPGTPDAVFASRFDRDVAHRDFACNSIYYDPISHALIDPTGLGVPHAEMKTLHLVCDPSLRNQYHLGQLTIRFFKFLRGCARTTSHS